jgi:hypothetical protein
MQVPVDGHPLALLPALDRGYVAIQVCSDFLPRIQAVFGWSDGWQRVRELFAHRSPDWLAVVAILSGRL